MYSEPMKTLRVVVICARETPIALAFSRVDRDQLLRIVRREGREQLRQFLMRSAGGHQLVRGAVQVAQRVPPWSCSMN